MSMVYLPFMALDSVKARNFSMREVSRSQMAVRHGIDNTPTPEVLERAKALAVVILQPLRDHFGRGYSPSSWFRCEELECVVAHRGYRNWLRKYNYVDEQMRWQQYYEKKQHPTGGAADIEIPGVSNDELFDWIRKNMTYDQLIREFPKAGDPTSGWVHVSYNPGENREMAFTIG